jgi:lipopolysaccharide export system protein LptA
MRRRALGLAVVLALVPGLAAGQLAPTGKGPAGARSKEDRSQPLTVDSDKMERFGKQSLVIFSGNVVARQNNSVQYADRVEVYLDEKGERVLRTVSTGGVRIITRDCRTGTAQRAEYFDLDQRVVLMGSARVWHEDNVVSGDTITIFLSEDRTTVEGGKQERVKGVFYPRDEDKRNGQAVAQRPTEPCRN